MPKELIEIFSVISDTVNRKFPDSDTVKYTAVSGFLFLRFFAPAILGPPLFGLKVGVLDAYHSRKLLLIAKTLQNLSNLCEFGMKEPFMAPMNKFINDNMKPMKDYIDKVTVPCPNNPKAEMEPPLQNEMDLDTSELLTLFSNSIDKMIEAAPSSTILPKVKSELEILNAKVKTINQQNELETWDMFEDTGIDVMLDDSYFDGDHDGMEESKIIKMLTRCSPSSTLVSDDVLNPISSPLMTSPAFRVAGIIERKPSIGGPRLSTDIRESVSKVQAAQPAIHITHLNETSMSRTFSGSRPSVALSSASSVTSLQSLSPDVLVATRKDSVNSTNAGAMSLLKSSASFTQNNEDAMSIHSKKEKTGMFGGLFKRKTIKRPGEKDAELPPTSAGVTGARRGSVQVFSAVGEQDNISEKSNTSLACQCLDPSNKDGMCKKCKEDKLPAEKLKDNRKANRASLLVMGRGAGPPGKKSAESTHANTSVLAGGRGAGPPKKASNSVVSEMNGSKSSLVLGSCTCPDADTSTMYCTKCEKFIPDDRKSVTSSKSSKPVVRGRGAPISPRGAAPPAGVRGSLVNGNGLSGSSSSLKRNGTKSEDHHNCKCVPGLDDKCDHCKGVIAPDSPLSRRSVGVASVRNSTGIPSTRNVGIPSARNVGKVRKGSKLDQTDNFNAPMCTSCSLPITAEYSKLEKKKYHPHCIACKTCGIKLEDTVYIFENKLYCGGCHHTAAGLICANCSFDINGQCIELKTTKVHPECARCNVIVVNIGL